ncbi:tyrosine-type recombinase/integrase [Sulfurospirillum halorespirans]|uniref:Tyr recombinase domain-containing protein n=1 Tax=Sulfurospirillum halorespirans DSM 13726 TaxID=1193502 RepID=A0A1D7TFQ8_9BACT|nr:tyrosine-type recombinase/integrase [Sulfurospirillum halorespirans]AOO63826.1 hypothetical protein SHALO_0023 [Sulfurospirillum halorespirans DSM 13726]
MKKDEKMTKKIDKNSIEYLQKIQEDIQEKINKIHEENGEFDEEFYESGLTKSQRGILKETMTFATKKEEQEYYEWRWKDEIENDKRIEELEKRKENEIFEIVKILEKKLDNSPKIDEEINKIKNNVLINLDRYYSEYIDYRKNFVKVSNDSIRTSNSSFRYLKYFIKENTVFNFSFFKEIQKKFQELPANFFKYEKYYKKDFEEVLKLKDIENYEVLNTKTINNHMSNYSKFFDYLIYEEVLTENPLKNIKSLKEEESEKIEYSQEDIDKIFNSKMEKVYLNMCKFTIYTGLRLEEVLSVKKEDIHDNLIHVTTLDDTTNKKHQRIIPVHKNIQNLIEYQKKHRKYKYLFFDYEKKNEVKNAGKRVNNRLKKIVNDKDKSFHSFRKNFSQEIELNTNSDEKTKKYLMGHSFKNDVTHTVYNKNKINIEKLRDCINQITFIF